MSERARERERERKTSLGFNDISNIHADAFCCFVLSFSAALPARVSSSPHTPQPGRGEGSEGGRGNRQVGGEKRRKKQPAKQASKLPQKPFLFVIKKGVTYLFFFLLFKFFFIILAGEEDEERGLREWGKRQSGKSEKEREIGGEAARRGTGAREAGGKRNQ